MNIEDTENANATTQQKTIIDKYNINNSNNTPITIYLNGVPTKAYVGTRISDVLSMELPCGGHGKCGKCKIKGAGALSPLTESEKKHLTEKEITDGIRLGCHTYILGECSIESLSESSEASVLTDGIKLKAELFPTFNKYAAAVDIGTTTVAARLIDTNGSALAELGINNPQSVFGADVISRIEASLAGKDGELKELIVNTLDSLVNALCEGAKISPKDIDAIAVTGNTVMLYLLTGTSPEPLSHAPFALTRKFNETLSAKELGLKSVSPQTEIYLPPCISAFIGADTVCAILSSGMLGNWENTAPSTDENTITSSLSENKAFLLADIGTNGEMALANNGTLFVCSTAAGPAFEGVGISRGMRGEKGAIDKVALVNGKLEATVIGGGEAKGICGSGLVDAVAALLDSEELDETGYLEDDEVTVLSPITLTAKDIRAVQLAKSAISAGICTLINEAGVSEDVIEALFIAGGFGNYLNKKSAARIGLLPEKLTEKTVNIGNAALSGAEMLLLNGKLRKFAEDFSHKANVVELSTSKYFSDKFISGMLF